MPTYQRGPENSLLDEEEPSARNRFGGAWTLIKLKALEKYLKAFNTALNKQSFIRIYVDAFAGTGRCDIKINGEKDSVDGSARRALATTPSFHKYFFIELQNKKIKALKQLQEEYPGKAIHIIQDDANAALKSLCTQYRWRDERAVLFLDPFGMHVEWATLEAIAKTGAIDVWYLFPYAGLYRQAAVNSEALDADKKAALTRLLGTDEWQRAFYMPKPQLDLFGDDAGEERSVGHEQMLSFVSQRLNKLFSAVTKPKILYQKGDAKNPCGAPLFALYFAASNPKPKAHGLAIKIAKDILDAL